MFSLIVDYLENKIKANRKLKNPDDHSNKKSYQKLQNELNRIRRKCLSPYKEIQSVCDVLLQYYMVEDAQLNKIIIDCIGQQILASLNSCTNEKGRDQLETLNGLTEKIERTMDLRSNFSEWRSRQRASELEVEFREFERFFEEIEALLIIIEQLLGAWDTAFGEAESALSRYHDSLLVSLQERHTSVVRTLEAARPASVIEPALEAIVGVSEGFMAAGSFLTRGMNTEVVRFLPTINQISVDGQRFLSDLRAMFEKARQALNNHNAQTKSKVEDCIVNLRANFTQARQATTAIRELEKNAKGLLQQFRLAKEQFLNAEEDARPANEESGLTHLQQGEEYLGTAQALFQIVKNSLEPIREVFLQIRESQQTNFNHFRQENENHDQEQAEECIEGICNELASCEEKPFYQMIQLFTRVEEKFTVVKEAKADAVKKDESPFRARLKNFRKLAEQVEDIFSDRLVDADYHFLGSPIFSNGVEYISHFFDNGRSDQFSSRKEFQSDGVRDPLTLECTARNSETNLKTRGVFRDTGTLSQLLSRGYKCDESSFNKDWPEILGMTKSEASRLLQLYLDGTRRADSGVSEEQRSLIASALEESQLNSRWISPWVFQLLGNMSGLFLKTWELDGQGCLVPCTGVFDCGPALSVELGPRIDVLSVTDSYFARLTFFGYGEAIPERDIPLYRSPGTYDLACNGRLSDLIQSELSQERRLAKNQKCSLHPLLEKFFQWIYPQKQNDGQPRFHFQFFNQTLIVLFFSNRNKMFDWSDRKLTLNVVGENELEITLCYFLSVRIGEVGDEDFVQVDRVANGTMLECRQDISSKVVDGNVLHIKCRAHLKDYTAKKVYEKMFREAGLFESNTIFIDALNGELESLKRQFNDKKIDINAVPAINDSLDFNPKMTALHYAIIGGDETVIKYLLSKKPDLTVKDGLGFSITELAALYGRFWLFEKLVLKDESCLFDLRPDVKKLLQQKNYRYRDTYFDDNGLTIFHRLVNKLKDSRALNWILESHLFDLDTRDKWGRSMLHHFVIGVLSSAGQDIRDFLVFDPSEHSTELSDELPDHKIYDSYSYFSGEDVIHETSSVDLRVIEPSINKFRQFLDFVVNVPGFDINVVDDLGRTALHDAVHIGSKEKIRALLDREIDTELADAEGLTVLDYAARNMNPAIFVALYPRTNKNLNALTHEGLSPLFLACRHGNEKTAIAILDFISDLAVKDPDQKIIFHYAAERGLSKVIIYLRDSLGADFFEYLYAPDRLGNTPLMLAVAAGHEATVHAICGHLSPPPLPHRSLKPSVFQGADRESLPTRKNVGSAALKQDFYNMEFQKIPKDGHCLFHAIGLYLGADAPSLRKLIAAHMEHNFDEYKVFRSGTDEEFRGYIEAIRNSNEWGDHIEIVIIQKMTNRPIIIIRPDENPTIPDNLEDFSGEPIFIYYNGTHYDAFLLKEGANPRDILNDIRSDMDQGRTVNYKFLEHSEECSLERQDDSLVETTLHEDNELPPPRPPKPVVAPVNNEDDGLAPPRAPKPKKTFAGSLSVESIRLQYAQFDILRASGFGRESILSTAIKAGYLEIAKFLCVYPKLIQSLDSNVYYSLIDNGFDFALTKCLLEAGADFFDLLSYYFSKAGPEHLGLLLSPGCHYISSWLSARKLNGSTVMPFSTTMQDEALAIVRGKRPPENGITGLHYAVMSGDIEFVKKNCFTHFAMDPLKKDAAGYQPADYADAFGYRGIADYLREVEQKFRTINYYLESESFEKLNTLFTRKISFSKREADGVIVGYFHRLKGNNVAFDNVYQDFFSVESHTWVKKSSAEIDSLSCQRYRKELIQHIKNKYEESGMLVEFGDWEASEEASNYFSCPIKSFLFMKESQFGLPADVEFQAAPSEGYEEEMHLGEVQIEYRSVGVDKKNRPIFSSSVTLYDSTERYFLKPRIKVEKQEGREKTEKNTVVQKQKVLKQRNGSGSSFFGSIRKRTFRNKKRNHSVEGHYNPAANIDESATRRSNSIELASLGDGTLDISESNIYEDIMPFCVSDAGLFSGNQALSSDTEEDVFEPAAHSDSNSSSPAEEEAISRCASSSSA